MGSLQMHAGSTCVGTHMNGHENNLHCCVSLGSASFGSLQNVKRQIYCRRFGRVYRVPSSGFKECKKKGKRSKFSFVYQ